MSGMYVQGPILNHSPETMNQKAGIPTSHGFCCSHQILADSGLTTPDVGGELNPANQSPNSSKKGYWFSFCPDAASKKSDNFQKTFQLKSKVLP